MMMTVDAFPLREPRAVAARADFQVGSAQLRAGDPVEPDLEPADREEPAHVPQGQVAVPAEQPVEVSGCPPLPRGVAEPHGDSALVEPRRLDRLMHGGLGKGQGKLLESSQIFGFRLAGTGCGP